MASRKGFRQIRSLAVIVGLLAQMLLPAAPAQAAAQQLPPLTVLVSGGAGTVTVGTTVYARSGGALTLSVTAPSGTKCVAVTGAYANWQTSGTSKTSWTFSFAAGTAGDGIQSLTVSATSNSNSNGCNGSPTAQDAVASFILDNTRPVVTANLAPSANVAGWNNANVTITWSATDSWAGVGSGPTPATDTVTGNTAGETRTATATDLLGNSSTGSVTVKLDKAAPTISGNRAPAANAYGWNNTDVTVGFTCSDNLSGIKSCTGATTLSANGSNQSVSGTAVDNADNTSSAAVGGINIDKTPPVITGAPTAGPNAAGWYNGNVTIHWTAADALSGLVAAPGDTILSGEGAGLSASASVSDKAGNTASAAVTGINIDKTAPTTVATAPGGWNNAGVSVSLMASDALSGVAATYYQLDGGAQQMGTAANIAGEGIHTLQFWSVDRAGNAEAPKSVEVKIDMTSPSISHTQSPMPNAAGWNNTPVTVTFVCSDALSGIASCTPPLPVAGEGKDLPAIGVAVDNAGNAAVDPATVSIDRTPPTISGAPDRAPNPAGWYNDNVPVTFTCGDALSGVAACTGAQTLGEGYGQAAVGTASDAAGNTATATVGAIHIDKTAPSLSGAPSGTLGGGGWYRGDVTVAWSCSDTLSGIDGGCPADSVITGEGSALSAGSTVADRAGNTASVTVGGIKIDRTAPSTLVSVPNAPESGWYAGDVLVTLNALDPLSGVAATYYSVDGGAAQVYSGPFTHSLKGIHTLWFWSVDAAGNLEDQAAPGHSLTLKIDGNPPTITGSRSPAANTFGWNNGPVTVSFACSDAESGVAGCSDPVTLTNEGAGQSVTGQAVDGAGNANSTTVSDINIDLTGPVVTGAATTPPNAAGWYKGDVTIHWTAQDGLSGVDPATQPVDSTITGEGANLGAGPVSAADKAGNVGTGTISGIKIDRTPPVISGRPVNDDGTPRSANAAGWYNSAVRVRFDCSDTLSGVQECAGDVVLSTDGTNQSAAGTATDRADNSASTTVSGIHVDSQAPQTSADIQCTSKNGWCRGNKATVILTAVDQTGLSGVKEIRYSTNGNSWKSASGNTVSVDLTLTGSGKSTVLFYAVDNAGNAEMQSGADVKYDTIAPTVTHVLTPVPNAAGWNRADVTVHFNAEDDSDGSGVDLATVTPDQTVTAETAGTVIAGSAEDKAGNVGTDSVTVRLDRTPPTISGATTAAPNASGWYNGPVTVHFSCSDALSGIATCPADTVLNTDGANQSAAGTAVDRADNSAGVTVQGINIDSVKPSVTVSGIANGAIYTLGAVPAAACTATDSGSGIDGACTVTVTGGQPNGVGTLTFTATATDKAGNTATATGSFRVIYRWDGFLQPINDSAHQLDQSVSIFKGGSTVPAKFQLKKADGTVVQAGSLPQWLTPVRGSLTTAPVDESVYSEPPTSGSSFRWDATAQQYIYNWGTPKGASAVGYYHRIGVTLDDGQTYYVNIGLK